MVCTLHAHEALCYSMGEIICTLTETEGHSHGEGCYEVVQSCASADEGHTHDDSICFESKLICEIPVHDAHSHADGCYEAVLICEEDGSHVHEAACYAYVDKLICTLEEGSVSEDENEEHELICEREVIRPHRHSEGCFEPYTDESGAQQRRVICGQPEITSHTHAESCYTISIVQSGNADTLTCTLNEDEEHKHTTRCYGTWELSCTMAEHTHDEECTPPEFKLTEATLPAKIYTDAGHETLSADTVEITVSGMLPECAELRAYPVRVELSGQVLFAYEMALYLSDGTVFEPESGNTLSVCFKHPQLPENGLEVYYIPVEGEAEPMGAVRTEDGLCFETDHFSTYAAVYSSKTRSAGSSVGTNGEGNVVIHIQNENYYTPGEIILIDGYLLGEFCDPTYFDGNPLPFGSYTSSGKAWPMNIDAMNSFRSGDISFSDYTVLQIEYLNSATASGGQPEYFVEAVIRGSAVLGSGRSLMNLAPRTDFGYLLFIPNSLLNGAALPKRGDLVTANFWHGQEERWNDSIQDWEGYGPRLGWNSGVGMLVFQDNPASAAYLATTGGTDVDVTVKVFDYPASINNHNNGFTFWNGDYGYGADVESVDGWGTEFVGHGANVKPYTVPTLSSAGFPQIYDGGEGGAILNLDYLFDGSYQTGSTMYGGGGLFRRDSQGYYYYDSLQNYAFFNGSSFVLYDDLIIRPWADANDSSRVSYGNFLPLNRIGTDNITMDGYIFDDSRQNQTGVTGWQGSLASVGQSVTSAAKTLDADGNNRLQERVVNEYSHYSARLEDPTNLWFGMTVEFEFYQSAGGKVNGNDMVFDFHGDDDVWVYVGTWNSETQSYDYKLVLDIGGAHAARSGTINFATGAVTDFPANEGSARSRSLKEIFSLPGDVFEDYEKLALKFFYIERGGNISYCRLNFNLPILPQKSLMVTKELQYPEGDSALNDYLSGAHSYKFRVMKANSSGEVSGVLIPEGSTYSLLEDGLPIGTAQVGEDGIFTLKAGQSAMFENLLQNYGNVNYVVQELISLNIEGQYNNVLYSINGGVNTQTNKDTSQSHDFSSFNTDVLSTAQSGNIVYRNTVDTEKLASLKITKAKAEGSDFEPGTQFPIQVMLGGSPVPVGTEYSVNGEKRPVTEEGIILLSIGGSAIIDGILSGTEYSVRELDGEYTASYSGITSGSFGIGQLVEITVTNADYAAHVAVPISKTYLGNSGTAAFNFALEQLDAEGNVISRLDGCTLRVSGEEPSSEEIYIKYSSSAADGLYYYRIYEMSGALNVLYDSTVYDLTVMVSRGADNKPEASLMSVTANGGVYTDEALSFVNRKLANVSITKTVSGTVSSDTYPFSFTASVFYNGEPFSPAENSAYTVNEDGTVSFTLTADETVYIRGIPVGAELRVTEAVPEGFIPSFIIGDTTLEADTVTFTVAESSNHIICDNYCTFLLPKTGGNGTAFFAAVGILLMAASSMLYFRYKKRVKRSYYAE